LQLRRRPIRGGESEEVRSKLESLSSSVLQIHETLNLIRTSLENMNGMPARIETAQSALDMLLEHARIGVGHSIDPPRTVEDCRESRDYENPFVVANPKVSVLIPTHTGPPELWSRAVPSVLSQSHQNLEVLIAVNSQFGAVLDSVNTGIQKLGDDRVKLVPAWSPNLEEFSGLRKWLASGSLEVNAALRESSGLWVSPFAHDDQLVPKALESLIEYARLFRLEMCYGDVIQIRDSEVFKVHCSDPPRLHEFGLQGSIRHFAFNSFRYHIEDAILGLPNDWAVMQRMRLAGIRVGHFCEPTCHYFPSNITES
jgi:hypothetical protein